MPGAYHTGAVTAKRLTIGKVPIDVLTFAEALDAIDALVGAKQGGFVFTPNIDHVVTVDEHPEFAAAYARASLSLADGMPVVWASRLLEHRLPEKISGSDLVGPLLERAAQKKWRVAFLGAGPGVAEKAAAIVRERYGTDVVYTDAPMVKLDDEAQVNDIAAKLAAAKPELVLMAFGAPKQELLIARIAERVKPAVLLGIGASLDFIAGTVKRAPVLMQKTGLEWLYRLGQEPRRLWRRYLVNDPKFLLILARTVRAR
jgi:N-acetylglucosaminyldiphosphoundecaprenol N-acetyl-beta-D-mannosaminyltransferase